MDISGASAVRKGKRHRDHLIETGGSRPAVPTPLADLFAFEDTWSGVDPLGASRREDLQAAVTRARAEGAVLVIPEPTRLFRNVGAARSFLETLDVPVFSVREGRILKAPALLRAIARGEDAARNIRKGTSEVLAGKRSEGITFASPSGRKKGASVSARNRRQKADRIAHDIASVLKSNPAYPALPHKALADHLNRLGIRSGWNRPWTEASVRGPRKKAEALLNERAEIEASDDVVGGVEMIAPRTVATDKPIEATVPVDPDDPDGELRKNPLYGMFGTR